MSDQWNVQLQMQPSSAPGAWTAEVSPASGHHARMQAPEAEPDLADSGDGPFTVTVVQAHLDAGARAALLAELRRRPQALYALLRGGPAPAELAGLLPAAPEAGACTCGRAGCAHAAAAVRAAAARCAAEPLQQLAQAGLPREALLAGVFGSWAEALADDPNGASRAAETAGRPQARGGEGGAAVGEWIAEAAADGALHQPGPGFGAVQVQLAEPGKPPALPQLEALLPGKPAAAGLALIRERVAARLWQAVRPQKDSKAKT